MADPQKQPQPIVFGEQPTAAKISQIYSTISRSSSSPQAPAKDIDDELTRSQKLRNDDTEQNIRLKRMVLRILFWFLGIETIFIFLFAFFQAIKWPFVFHLDEWSFNILITATIIQIASMLLVAVRYLFPTKEEK